MPKRCDCPMAVLLDADGRKMSTLAPLLGYSMGSLYQFRVGSRRLPRSRYDQWARVLGICLLDVHQVVDAVDQWRRAVGKPKLMGPRKDNRYHRKKPRHMWKKPPKWRRPMGRRPEEDYDYDDLEKRPDDLECLPRPSDEGGD